MIARVSSKYSQPIFPRVVSSRSYKEIQVVFARAEIFRRVGLQLRRSKPRGQESNFGSVLAGAEFRRIRECYNWSYWIT